MHGDGVRVHGKVQEAERDNGARGRCTGAGGKVQGTGAERDNGARGRCMKGTGAERDKRCTGTVHG